MKKSNLVASIQANHRQLERYLFYFEKNSAGEFIASDRPKFGVEEMLQPGILAGWSLKDLLVHLIDWERHFLGWVRAGQEGEDPGDVPPADLDWAEIDPVAFDLPVDLAMLPAGTILAEFKDSYRLVLGMVESTPDEDLFTPGVYSWMGKDRLYDYVLLCTARHYEWAKGLVRHWRKTHAGSYLNQQIVLERIRSERQRLERNLDRLDADQMETPGVNGDWTVKDILAHLADWEQRFIGWYEAGQRGETPETPAQGLGWDRLDLLNQQIRERHRDRTLDDVCQWFDSSFQRTLKMIEAMPEEELFAAGRYEWLGENCLVTVVLANTANHYRWANRLIHDWRKTQGLS